MEKTMFPHNMTLDETRAVIKAHNEALGATVFIEADRGDHVIFNYLIQFPEAFPEFTGDPARDRELGIIRECRGLIFDSVTGKVISRRFQKFFNLGQNAETQIDRLDFTKPHVIMDKLDGSMISAFRPHNELRWRWGTKMGETDVAKPVLEHIRNNLQYNDLADWVDHLGATALFEWTSRQQRIVLDYPEDQLVLLHVRDIKTGEYMSRAEVNALGEKFNIPTVRVIEGTINDIHEFVKHTKGLKGLEGYVVQFEDGMIKLKADEYCLLHNTKEKLNLEKNVLSMITSEVLDDILPQMDENDRNAVIAYEKDVMAGAAAAARVIEEDSAKFLSQITSDDPKERRKQYALMVNDIAVMPHSFYKRLMFTAYDGRNLLPEVVRIIGDNVSSSTNVALTLVLRGGVNWNDYRGHYDADT
jgi:RNA ligase